MQGGDERAKQRAARMTKGVVGSSGNTTPNPPRTRLARPTISQTIRIPSFPTAVPSN
jgi:hypothetical protein